MRRRRGSSISGLLYRALLDKQVDLVAGNSTDGLLAARDLVVLEDDKHYFPPYEAVPIVREDTLARHPEVRAAIEQLSGKISDARNAENELCGGGRRPRHHRCRARIPAGARTQLMWTA